MTTIRPRLVNHRLRLCWGTSRRIARDAAGRPYDKGGFDAARTLAAWRAADAIARNINRKGLDHETCERNA